MEKEQATADRRTYFEKALVTVKALKKKARAPVCFLSYAWDTPEHGKWMLALAKDLRNAGIDVIFDQWNKPGSSLSRFIEQIVSSDFVVPVGTPRLLKKYETEKADPVVDAELRLINLLLMKRTNVRERVIPLLRDADAATSLPPLLQDPVYLDFRLADGYFANLFDLILTLYGIEFTSPAVADLREMLRARVP